MTTINDIFCNHKIKMKRLKIDYGIDLGTTNSSIVRMENGEPVIMRTDTLREVMPSCVSFTRRQSVKVGDGAYNDMKQDKRRATRTWKAETSNTFIEFKRTMGTDTTYHSRNMERDYTSEELSAEVLKRLKSFVGDDTPNSIVITVPAKFTVNQKTATMEAAKMAGFTHCELLQEPIAAAMAYGLSSDEKDGYWLVFDFGGGTFDAALLKVEEGIIQVVDTEGDNYLGGKNLDFAIVDKLLLPYLGENFAIEGILADPQKKEVLRYALKTYAEEAKIQLSTKMQEDILTNLGDLGEDDDGEELELDLTITREQADNVMRPLMQKAVDICLEVLRRNALVSNQLNKVVLVGGPTLLPLVKRMLVEQLSAPVDSSINPMTAVAVGAALYASTIDVVKEEKAEENDDTVTLDLGYEPTTVEMLDWVAIKLADGHGKVAVEIVRGDKGWSSGKVDIDDKGRVVEVQLEAKKPNSFSVIAYDDKGNVVPCFPNKFVIIQGTKVGNAVLPYHIGISVWDDAKDDGVFQPFAGLEKNKLLPAVGIIRGKHTTQALRPGMANDKVSIPIYQADAYKGKMRANLFEWVCDVVVTGDDVPDYVPQGSEVEVTLKVDVSEQMTMEVYFPLQDFTMERQLDTGKKQSVEEAGKKAETYLMSAHKRLMEMKGDQDILHDFLQKLAVLEEEAANTNEKKALLQHLKELLRKMEDYDQTTQWERVYEKLAALSNELTIMHSMYGMEADETKVKNVEMQVKAMKRSENVRQAEMLINYIEQMKSDLKNRENEILWLRYFHKRFTTLDWKDETVARALVDKAIAMISPKTTTAELAFFANRLYVMVNWPERKENSGGTSNEDSKHVDPVEEKNIERLLM